MGGVTEAGAMENAEVKAEELFRVAVIGSGNWGSVAAKLIASNTVKQSMFHGT